MYCCMITGNVSLLSTKLYLYSVDNWHHLRHVFVRQRAGNDGRIQATASRLNRRHSYEHIFVTNNKLLPFCIS